MSESEIDPRITTISYRNGFTVLDAAAAKVFGTSARALVLFPGDPVKVREATDALVILGETVKEIGGAVSVGVVPAQAETPDVVAHYGVLKRPALAVVCDGAVVEVLPGLQDWGAQQQAVNAALNGAAASAAE